MTFVKHAASVRAAAWEAAGLDWLRVDRGAAVVEVLSVDGSSVLLQRLSFVSPSVAAAEAFGRALAATHAVGASAYGVGPGGWDGDGYQGPADDLLPLPLRPYQSWGAMYADLRLAPLLERGSSSERGASRVEPRRSSSERGASQAEPRRSSSGRGASRARVSRPAQSVLERLRDGEFDGSCTRPARLHGDLWSGNVIWTAAGAVLIDPAAHGGHPESDLAALALFGAPHLEAILAAYQEVTPLPTAGVTGSR